MGKKVKTIYTCDRCGKEIDNVFKVGRVKCWHIFRWFEPSTITMSYNMRYICQDCFASFKKWYKEKQPTE